MKSYAQIPNFGGFQHSSATETKKHLYCLNLQLSSCSAFSKILPKFYVLQQNTFYSINPAIAHTKMMNLHLTPQGAVALKHNDDSSRNVSSYEEGKVYWFHYVQDLTPNDYISL